MAPLCFAYYCSGHGYGHATRVSAFASHLLNSSPEAKPIVYIASSAPEHVFADSIANGAVYRYAEIDPVIVQPLAYCVDRQKSVDVLKSFLSKKDILLEVERQWLVDIQARAVLSDAAFLGCLAANVVGIPSILITNFTFDSVYSYLSTPIVDDSVQAHLSPTSATAEHQFSELTPDIPISPDVLEPLVNQICAGYRCANMLLLLPGHIPIPSFSVYPSLPSRDWVDVHSNTFHPEIIDFLSRYPSSYHPLYPSIPFPPSSPHSWIDKPRSVVLAPLIVRPPSSPLVFTPAGRSRLLASIDIPTHLQNPETTKILVVSFGGQIFRKPSRSGSRSPSRNSSGGHSPHKSPQSTPITKLNGHSTEGSISELNLPPSIQQKTTPDLHRIKDALSKLHHLHDLAIPSVTPPRIATPSHLWIPGAPPASKQTLATPPLVSFSAPVLATIPPTPSETGYFDLGTSGECEVEEARLLPDESWIAIVCGVSKDQKLEQDEGSDLPDRFFIAPKDVYMPDLTAIGNVLLGKLGYGTVSECIDSCTPFVYVSRPLFIEEHGTRFLLEKEGVGVELSRQSYEAGDWAGAVHEAWVKGKAAKTKKRMDMVANAGLDRREKEGRIMAETVIDWTRDWWESEVSLGNYPHDD